MPPRAPRRAAHLLLPLLVAASACDRPSSLGSHTDILVALPADQWEALRTPLLQALEPRTFSVGGERPFEVAHADPHAESWPVQRRLRQLLLIGHAGDPWIAPALRSREGSGAAVTDAVEMLEARDVWARPQRVRVLLLPEGVPLDAAAAEMSAVGEAYLRDLREYARERMYAGGEWQGVGDSLRVRHGFSLRLPRVYRAEEPLPGVVVMRNDQPDPSRLIRQITVASRPNGDAPTTPEGALAWRAEIVAGVTVPPQRTDSLHATRTLDLDGRRALEIRTAWSNPPGGWPAGGPVLTRVVDCGGRAFLVDGWVYAPGRAKYEYMVQIQTIIDSFRCG